MGIVPGGVGDAIAPHTLVFDDHVLHDFIPSGAQVDIAGCVRGSIQKEKFLLFRLRFFNQRIYVFIFPPLKNTFFYFPTFKFSQRHFSVFRYRSMILVICNNGIKEA